MARAVVKDLDLGWEQIEKELLKFSKSTILIGFQEDAITKEQKKGTREKEGGLSIAQIAFENEFGTRKIPARPFLTTSFDENKDRILNGILTQLRKVEDGKIRANTALGKIGEGVVTIIKQKIRSITTPPNSPVTIALKGSSKPLIDFGQMINSVRYKINA